MSLAPEITERIQAVEAKLAALDPILHDFCTRRGYTFSSKVGVWPRRKVWAREEIDRSMDLVMDLTVQEVMDRGFSPDMPWSLHATGSFPPARGEQRILTRPVFTNMPYSQLAPALPAQLEAGLAVLRTFTRDLIISSGET